VTPSQRLLGRLRDELGLDIPGSAQVRRTYAGSTQLAQGAWKWFVLYEGDSYRGRPDVGSHYSVADILGSARIQATDDMWVGRPTGQSYSIDPVDPDHVPAPGTRGLVAITPEANAV
jgi:hypothetical protein